MEEISSCVVSFPTSCAAKPRVVIDKDVWFISWLSCHITPTNAPSQRITTSEKFYWHGQVDAYVRYKNEKKFCQNNIVLLLLHTNNEVTLYTYTNYLCCCDFIYPLITRGVYVYCVLVVSKLNVKIHTSIDTFGTHKLRTLLKMMYDERSGI